MTKVAEEAKQWEKHIDDMTKDMKYGHSAPPPENDEDADMPTMDLVVVEPKEIAVNAETPDYEQNTIDDYTTSRDNLHYIIEQGQELLKGAIKHAEMAPGPRSIEVASILIKNLGELSQKLNDVNRDYKELNKPEEDKKNNTTTNNNVFVGSLEEVMEAASKSKVINNNE